MTHKVMCHATCFITINVEAPSQEEATAEAEEVIRKAPGRMPQEGGPIESVHLSSDKCQAYTLKPHLSSEHHTLGVDGMYDIKMSTEESDMLIMVGNLLNDRGLVEKILRANIESLPTMLGVSDDLDDMIRKIMQD